MLGYAGVVIAELIEVYERFGDRKVKGRMVVCSGICVYRGGWKIGSPIWGISARRALWSLCYVLSVVEVVDGSWDAPVDMRVSQ